MALGSSYDLQCLAVDALKILIPPFDTIEPNSIMQRQALKVAPAIV